MSSFVPNQKLIDLNKQFLIDLQQGSPSAMEKIYEVCWERLFDLAMSKFGDVDLATEIVQEVLISLWENRSRIQIETSLNAYFVYRGKISGAKLLQISSNKKATSRSVIEIRGWR